jgi:hypothetical protein
MSLAEFLRWEDGTDTLFELYDGNDLPVRTAATSSAMTIA